MFVTIRHAATALAALSALGAAPAFAAGGEDVVPYSATVRHDDLNLASAGGVAQLQERLHRAARVACAVGDARDLASASRAATCEKTAMQAAQAKVEVAVASARSGAQLAANSVTTSAIAPLRAAR